MIRAVFFDFNGVIIDDEPVHFKLFQEVLADEGISLNKEDYYKKYLGMDDHDCLKTAAQDQKKPLKEEKIRELILKKSQKYQNLMKSNPPWVPGVVPFIRDLTRTHYLAIASGALRSEIESLLKLGEIFDAFSTIVAAGEIKAGKPSPEGFQTALQLLNRDFVATSDRLLPEECLVIEDSIWGIKAAEAAQMPCLAVTTSFPKEDLPGALIYLKDFSEVKAEELLNRVGKMVISAKGEVKNERR